MPLDDGNPFSDLVPSAQASDASPFADLVPAKDKPKLDLEAPVGSEGFVGGVADFGRGLAHGAISGLPTQIGKAAEFFGAEETGKKLQAFGKEMDLPGLRTSIIGQRERANDVLSVRGAAGEAGENTPLSVGPGVAGAAAGAALGSVVPGVGTALGAAGGYLVGSLAALPIFYGSQAQESKETIKAGLIKSGMPEAEAEAQARKGGHAAGAVEAGGELAADLVPFGALAKPFAKPVAGALVRGMFGGGAKKALGTLAKIEGGEVATEVAQTAAEKEIEHQFGAEHEGATLKDSASVIVPTALMSLLPGGLTVAHNFHTIGKVKGALESGEADEERRAAAAATVFHEIAKHDPGVAQAFDQYAADRIAAEEPIEIKDDSFYSQYASKIAAERAFPPAQPTPAEQAGIDANAGPLSAAAATALNTGATQAASEARAAPAQDAQLAADEERIRTEDPDLSDEEVAQALQKEAAKGPDAPIEDAADSLPQFPGMKRPDAYIESIQKKRAELGKEEGEKTQPLPPKQMMPFPTVEAARKAADAVTKRTSEAYEVVPHPYRHDHFAIVPSGRKHEFTKPEPVEAKPKPKTTTEREPVTIEGTATRVMGESEQPKALPAPKKDTPDAASDQVQGPAKADGANKDVPSNQADAAGQGQGQKQGAGLQSGPAKLPPFRQVAEALRRKAQTPVDAAAHAAAASPTNDRTPPTQAQAEAGNYAKGHAKVGPFDISVENPEGSQRSNFDTARIEKVAAAIPAGAPSLSLKGKAALEEAASMARAGQYDKAIERAREAANLLLAQHPAQSEVADDVAEGSWANQMKAHYGYFRGLPISRADKDHLDTFVKPGTKEDHAGPVYVIDQGKKEGGFDEHKVMVGYASPMEAAAAYKSHYPKDHKVGKITPATPEEFIAWAKTGNTSMPFADRQVRTTEESTDKSPPSEKPKTEEKAADSGQKTPQTEKTPDSPTPPGGAIGVLVKPDANGFSAQMTVGPHKGLIAYGANEEVARHHLARIVGEAETLAAKAKERDDKKAAKEAELQRKQAVRSAQTDLYGAASRSDGFRSWHTQDDAAIRETLEKMAPTLETSVAPHILKDPELISDKLIESLKAESKKVDAKLAKAEAKEAAEKNALKQKLRNTGDDLRRHWELEKTKIRARNDAEGITAMNQIFAATQRADFFRLPDAATPGTRKIVEQYRDAVVTFKDWVTGSDGHISRGYNQGITEAIESFVKGNRNIPREVYRGIVPDARLDAADFKSDVADRIAYLTKQADDYVAAVSKIAGAVTSQTRAQSALLEIQSFIWSPKAHGDLARFAALVHDGGNKPVHPWGPPSSWNRWSHENMTADSFAARRDGILYESNLNWFLPGYTSASLHGYVAKENEDYYAGKVKPLVPPRLERIERTVEKVIRTGDVTPKQFKETFGFADVGFGSWVGAKEDQTHLNYSYDAFMDLANRIGIDPKQIGFGGKLHFTIGALGHGAKAAATFHPAHPGPNGPVKAINVTKTKGDGTVAHEWLHALDDHLHGDANGSRAMRDIRNALVNAYDFERTQKSVMGWLKSATHYSRETKIQNAVQNARYYRSHVGVTSFKSEADKLGKDYWGNDQELRARAWEGFIGDTLLGRNDYLVNKYWSGDGKVGPPEYRGKPYPAGDERKRFNQWYQHLIESLVVKDGTLAVDWAKWQTGKPPGLDEYQSAVDALIDDIPALMAQVEAEKEAATAAQLRDQEKAQAEAAAAQQREDEAAAAQPAAPEPTGELNDDDLEALFDAAADNVTAEARENITAPEPGEPALRDEPGLEATPKVAAPTETTFAIAMVDGVTKLRTSAPEVEYTTNAGKTLQGVIYRGTTREQAQEIDKFTFPRDGGFFVRMKHVVRPEARTGTAPETTAPVRDKAGATLIAEAAKLGVKGIDEALTGLTKLFGGGKIQSFPGGFDQKTYDEAKPHFAESLKAFQAAGRTLKEFFEFLIAKLGIGVKPYAIAFAKDMKLTAQLGDKPDGTTRVAQWVEGQLNRPGEAVAMTSRELFAEADQAFGGTMGEGKYTAKDAYDAVEAGMNRWILANGHWLSLDPQKQREGPKSAIALLGRMTNRLPTATQRTGEQDEFQQFSTVPALAYMANWVANIKEGETYLEPSAGIGGLAVFGRLAGANVVLNELSSRRAEVLRKVLPGAPVTSENAEMIHNILPDDIRPTVIVMNPPFSSTAGRVEGQRNTMNGAKHVLSALDRLMPGGRLVAIVGDMNTTTPRWVEFWDKVKAEHTVRANVEVNGAEYRKYGTTFDNRIIVIDKVGPHTGVIVTGRAESYADLPGLLTDVRRLRHEPSRSDLAPQQDGSQLPSGDTAVTGVDQPGSTAPPVIGNDGARPGNAGGGDGALDRPGKGGVGGGAAGGGQSGGGVGGTAEGDRAGRAGRPDTGTGVADGAGSDQGLAGSGVVLDGEGITRRNAELTDAIFEAYEPRKAKVTGAKPHPSLLVESAAMASVDPVDVTYVPNLPKELIEKGLASGAQLEAVIYAGQAHAQTLPDGARRGYFIGDGTGVGKGREISAIIMDNMRQGRKKHLWISAKAGLKNDAIRDWTGIGGKEEELFALADENGEEGESAASIKVKRKDGVMFTTYATMRQPAKVDTGGLFPDESDVVVSNPLGPNNGTAKLVGISAGKRTVKVRQGEKVTVHPFAQILSINGDRGWMAKMDGDKGRVRSRLDQIVEWLGEDFDGTIIFDEAHNMGNLGGEQTERGAKEASAQALQGLALQKALPQARVVYVSATGATEVANLMYASRLGLWGPGTVFPDPKAFVEEISSAGLSTMELIARDLKMQGSYIARSISFEGVTYRQLDVPLTQLQSEAYDTLAIAWQIVLKDIKAAMEQTDMAKSKDKGSIMSQFWGAQLRFFNQVITAMQVPEILEDAKKKIAAGESVMFQLVNTDEATQEKLATKAMAEGKDLEELDFSPRETLIEFVRKSYPIVQYIEVADPGGGKSTYVPAKDSNGKPVVDKALVAARDKLIRDIEQIKSVPSSPVDAIINELGEEIVAEVTGRGRRFLTKTVDGEIKVVEQKRGIKAREADARAFNDDKKRALIFSDAGGTGFSFHADRDFKNQRKRNHYLVQPGFRADNVMQGFGRSHRTNESSQPEYVMPRSNQIRAQKRFISSIARRLDQLGALTKGQRNTTSGGMFTNRDNLESKYAQAALRDLMNDIGPNRAELFPGIEATFKYGGEFGARADLPTGGTTNAELVSAMGLDNVYHRETGELVEANVPQMRKFMNRLLSLTLAQQDIVFGEFERRFDAIVDDAITKGTFDDGMQTVKASAVQKTRDEVVFTDARNGATTRFVEFELTKPTTLNTFEAAITARDSHPGRGAAFYRDNRNGDVFIAVDEGSRMGGNGRPVHRGYRINVRAPSLAQRGRYIDNMDSIKGGGEVHIFKQEVDPASKSGLLGYKTHEQRGQRYTEISQNQAEYLWAEQHEATPKTFTENMAMLTGILLPVWDRVKVGKEGRAAAVVRTQTDEGERFIGRLVPDADRPTILKNFGLGAIRSDIPTQELINRVQKGETALLANGWRIKVAQVQGEKRLEIIMTSASAGVLRQLQDDGALLAKIDWDNRVFVPNGAQQVQVFEKVTRGANRPVVDFAPKGEAKLEITQQGRGMSLEAMGQRATLPPGMSKTQLRGVILPIIKGWKNGPPIKVVQYASEIPYPGLPWSTRGAVYDGVTYLVADNMHSAEAAQFVLLHEVAGHYGLNGMFGDTLNPLLDQIYRSNPKIKVAADKRHAQYQRQGYPISITAATEEALADLAGTRELEGVAGWRLLVAAIRNLLRKVGFTLKMADSDVAALLRDARRFVEQPRETGRPMQGALQGAAAKLEVGETLIARAVREVHDATHSAKQFNWLHRTVSTQFHKAQINPYFRPVFESAQQYLQDVSAFAHESADLAGEDILPRLGSLKDAFKNVLPTTVKRINDDLDAAGRAIWAATLADMRPTREQLLEGFTVMARDDARIIGEITVPALTEQQYDYYQRVRASLDLSLDHVAVSEMARMAKSEGITDVLALAKADATNGYGMISQAIHEQAATLRSSGDLAAAAKKEALIEQLAEQQSRVELLKEQGYAPLMRFGQYTVKVTGMTTSATEETLYFGMFEGRREANKMADAMREQYPEATVTRGVMDEESWKLYRGMSLDSIEAFARAVGLGEWPMMQEYLKTAVASRSALKRLIHRKGIQGFDEDLRRVLAGFVTSQARLASRNYHFSEMTDAHAAIPSDMGDVKSEAAKLIGYVQNPVEEAQGLRGLLFVNFIGGSVASALTNLTQPVMMTLPYLSQFGGPGRAAKALADALPIAGGSLATDPELREAMDRAAKEGITEPQELHQLYAESIRSIGSNLWTRKGLRVWGSMFSLAETFNRRITFAAAFQMANREGALNDINRVRDERNLPPFDSPFAFAESAVEDTQGIYNRGNRPNWARGAIGATLFTFKQFTIAYLEFLMRLPPREKALAGALLLLAAGLQGAPGADDLENLIDTIGQLMGYNTNSKKALREGAVKILGESLGGFLTHGVSGVPGVPLDVQGRLGLRQLVPLSGMFKRSETDKGNQVLDAIGPAGGLVQQVEKGATALAAGNLGGFFAQGTPVAVQNALKGFDMWQSGFYKDTRGRKVINTDHVDATLKILGIQPQDVAVAQRKAHDVRQDVEMAKTVETGIADRWARAIIDKDQDGVQKAQAEWRAWNVKNPETPILITPQQIRQRIEQTLMERAVRTIKAAPKELRPMVREGLQ